MNKKKRELDRKYTKCIVKQNDCNFVADASEGKKRMM